MDDFVDFRAGDSGCFNEGGFGGGTVFQEEEIDFYFVICQADLFQ